ncbi:MAG: transcription termination/antitermination protein NusA [Patescibacteria group bacterium]|nr:MAG: transcription termination/antitermination protein NusA [Patescibacteria group bacterium]
MTIIKSEFALALNQVASERGISPDDVIASIEAAVIAAYKKEYPEEAKNTDIIAKVNKETGETLILKNGKNITPPGFGRIAAQTAKQVILQKIREVEKKTIASNYKSQIGKIIKGRIIRYDGHNVYLDIGKAEALLPKEEQIKNERYQINNSLIVYLKSIENDKFGNPRIIVSRSHPNLILELFKREVPEVANENVVIKKVVREPGERAKIAVFSSFSGIDPVGACVGQKGVRVQTVTDELGGNEKIDVIQWSQDKKQFLIAALSPAKIQSIELDEKNRKAKIFVDETQAPLAIGKNGVNVNLASELTGLNIDIIQVKPAENYQSKQETSEQSKQNNK